MSPFRSRHRRQKYAVIGIAWYKPEQWQRLRDISIDKDDLEDTYFEWIHNAENGIQELQFQGVKLEKVDVDVEELLQWCDKRRVPVNGESRSSYAADKLREIKEAEAKQSKQDQ